MIYIGIYKNDELSNSATFDSQPELDSWLNYHISIGTFCFEDEYKTVEVVVSDEVVDENGETISPKVTETSHVLVKEATHTKEIIVL